MYNYSVSIPLSFFFKCQLPDVFPLIYKIILAFYDTIKFKYLFLYLIFFASRLGMIHTLVYEWFWIRLGLVYISIYQSFINHLFPIYMPYIYIDIWHINGE